MGKSFKGMINVDDRDSSPTGSRTCQPVAPAGAPNVLYIVLDDVGFSAMEPWGGLIETPNINRLAEHGLTYTNWHTTALCSPTRSSLLTGRNHTTNGMACIAEATSGFPNSNGHIPFECATIAEVLGERGWNTYMLGKWHLVAADEMNMASTKRNWPVGRGFERYYGFLGGETNQWYPDLVYDNHLVEQPPRCRRTATTSRPTSPTRRSSSSRTRRRSRPTSRSSCTSARARRTPRTTRRRSGSRSTAASSTWATRLPRARVRAPEGDGHLSRRRRAVAAQPVRRGDERRRQAVAAARRRPAVGLAVRRREAAVLPHGRGLRRLPLATPITRSGDCSTSSRSPASSRTRSSCSSPTTARAARAGRTVRSTRTSSSTGSPTRSRRTCSTSTSWARPRPTTTTRSVGRGRSTRRSRCGSATTSRAASPTR